MDLLIWLFIGGAAGWLAGVLTKGKGFGCLGNVIVGVIGSVLGGWLFSVTNLAAPGEGLVGSIVTALIGAVVLIIILRLLFK
jgi:uncharacterized membrane protein YeaQ/YmgE (transglycosylase-associated protein family)